MTDAELLALEAHDLDKPATIKAFGDAACRSHSVADAEVAIRKLRQARQLRRFLMIHADMAVREIETAQESWSAETAAG